MNYTLEQFQWSATAQNITAVITQSINGLIWKYTKSINGAKAQEIWDNRGKSEEELIAMILAA